MSGMILPKDLFSISQYMSNLFNNLTPALTGNFNAIFNLIIYYVAPGLLIYFLIRGLLEDIGLFERYSNGIAAVIAIIALPGGSYIAAWLIANFASYGVLALFAALLFLGMGNYYKKRLMNFNYVLNNRLLTLILAYFPLITFMTIGLGILGYVLEQEAFFSNSPLAEIIFIVIGISLIVSIVISFKKEKIKTFLLLGLPYIVTVIYCLISSGHALSFSFSLLGFYGSILLLSLHRQNTARDYLKTTETIRRKLLEQLNEINVAIGALSKLEGAKGDVKKADLSEKEKGVLKLYGITPEGRYDIDTLKKTKSQLENTREVIQGKLENLYDKTLDKVVEES